MKKRTLPLSLLIGAALTLPSLAMAAPTTHQSVDKQASMADRDLQTELGSAQGQQNTSQANPFKISETKTISVARTNGSADMASQVNNRQQSSNGMQQSSNGTQQSSNGMQQSSNGTQQSSNGMQKSSNGSQQSSNSTQQSSKDMSQSQNGMQQPNDMQPIIR